MVANARNHWNIKNKRHILKYALHCIAMRGNINHANKNNGDYMQSEFTEIEIEEYFRNLTPAEKGEINIEDMMEIEDYLADHFADFKTISLKELMFILK